MPQFVISDAAKKKAERAAASVSGLIREGQGLEPRRRTSGFRDKIDGVFSEMRGVPLKDVSVHIWDFASDYYWADRYGIPLPCAALNEEAIVPIIFGVESSHETSDSPFSRDAWLRQLEEHAVRAWRSTNRLLWVDPGDALRGFTEGLRTFLQFRFEGYWFGKETKQSSDSTSNWLQRYWLGQNQPQTPGTVTPEQDRFYVTLTCRTKFLRAHVSPGFGIAWRQFGYPTSPVTGALEPGTWLFGADGGRFDRIVPDTVLVDIPPTFEPCALAF
jgi:hypothetical protein